VSRGKEGHDPCRDDTGKNNRLWKGGEPVLGPGKRKSGGRALRGIVQTRWAPAGSLGRFSKRRRGEGGKNVEGSTRKITERKIGGGGGEMRTVLFAEGTGPRADPDGQLEGQRTPLSARRDTKTDKGGKTIPDVGSCRRSRGRCGISDRGADGDGSSAALREKTYKKKRVVKSGKGREGKDTLSNSQGQRELGVFCRRANGGKPRQGGHRRKRLKGRRKVLRTSGRRERDRNDVETDAKAQRDMTLITIQREKTDLQRERKEDVP